MNRILLFIALFAAAFTMNAQLVSVEVETVAVHDTDNPDITELAGMTTYRIYATLTNETDFVSACAGLASFPLEVNTTTQFYQSSVGSATGTEPNNLLIGLGTFPALQYDSYVTIGMETDASPGSGTTALPGAVDWAGIFEDYQPGVADHTNNIVISDNTGGGWFSTDPDQSLAGADLRVLLGQFTTDGVLSGFLNVQVFIEWVQGETNNVEANEGLPFSSNPGEIFGCTDPTATNYNENATSNDGSCVFPCAVSIDDVMTTTTSCVNTFDGTAEVMASGQQGILLYSLDGANNTANPSFINLGAGEYNLLATDDQGCTDETTFTVEAPEELVVTTTLTQQITCNGETDAEITISSTGGTGTVMFDQDPMFSNPTMETILSDVGPGNYTVYGIDDNGCEASSIALNVTQPTVLVGAIQATADAACNGEASGLIQAFAAGGSAPYQYSIDGGTTWNNNNLIDVAAGEYTLDIQDANGCLALAVSTETIGEPMPLVVTTTPTGVACFGDTNGMITASAEGGNGDYMYAFDGGMAGMDTEWMDLAGGDYMLTVTDAEGCTEEVMVSVTEPEELTVEINAVDVLCNGEANGVVNAVVEGGTEDYMYSLDGADAVMTSSFIDLADGSYTVTVTDANGCTTEGTGDVAMPDAITITVDEVVASNGDDGSISISADGGTGDLSYDWTGPDNFTSDAEDLTDLADGTYTVTVTDENGCEVTEDVIEVLVGINELGNNITVQVYPNPNNGVFTLNFDGLNGDEVIVNIMDAQGRIVENRQINAVSGNYSETVDMTNVSSGMYYMTFISNGYKTTQKIVKQ